KVQDMQQGWSFVVRLLDPTGLSEQLVTAAERGDIEQSKLLLDAGANVNHQNSTGVTALNNARLSGREEVARLLVQSGAKEVPMPSVETLVDGLYRSLEGKKASGVAVLVGRDGEVVLKKGFGYADIE